MMILAVEIIPSHKRPTRPWGSCTPRIKAQTLVIAGAEDRFVPAPYVEAFGRPIPGARTAIVPNAAHMVPYEQPAAVLRIVDEWLNAKEKAA